MLMRKRSLSQLLAPPSFSYETEAVDYTNMTDTNKKDERTDRQDEAAPLPGIPHPAHHARLVGWPLKAFQEKLLKRARKRTCQGSPRILSLEKIGSDLEAMAVRPTDR